ncbi:ATP-binding cassette domain-containing protein [Rhodobacteraceae bacterium 2CG4]|uniref:ATP-binding cassette domain-containing protein n=1 Tax=Halovulum marinum TaxID=2662447 RepID=A0A6L5Z0A2_9RHOB|nr:ABC transporter ATP-binding protein [Halovulum marinum]MSU89540.1 ATP-binding cassette domain-containing protein [Halovulum marinum]
MFEFSKLVAPFQAAKGPPPGDSLRAFVAWALHGAWRWIGLTALLGGLSGLTEIASAFLIGWVIDDALAHQGGDYLAAQWPLLLAIAAFYLLLRPAILGVNAAMSSLAIAPNATALVLSRLHAHVLGQHIQYFDDDFAGRLAQKAMQTSRALVDAAVEICNTVVFAGATLIGATFLIGGMDARLALALLAWLAAYGALIIYFLPRIRKRAKARAGARAAVTGQLVDTLTNMKTVKLFAHTAREEDAARLSIGRYRGAALDFGRLSTRFRVSLNVIAGALPVLMIGGALMLWQAGAATAGEIATAGIISSRIGQMTGWVSFTAMGIFSHIGEVEDGMKTLTPPPEVTDRPGAPAIGRVAGEIVFDDVRFHYGRGRESGGLNGLGFRVAPGEKVALVGASGAGKSTALALLLRLYDREAGRIAVDGRDVAEVRQESLRAQISMVTQETAMFNRSARENILYGRPDATEDEIHDAARRAEAHDFIQSLRDVHGRQGYDAHLGERGVKLSGGQRQRIALARAILKDAPVLLLDEATSALDSEVEAEIQSALWEVMQDKTVIAIAHRLSTIARMDRILVIDDGRVVEQGTHSELLKRGGLYARFWDRQSGGFLNLEAAE